MPWRSRQAKKPSRASQQRAREVRSGASKAPSAEGVGVACDGWGWGVGGGEEEEKRPIVSVFVERVGLGVERKEKGGFLRTSERRVQGKIPYRRVK